MNLYFSECDYDYLRPPKEVFDVTHSDYYIRHGEGKKTVRKIFANGKYYDDELEKLQEFQALIESEKINLPQDWPTVDTFRFMYSGKLDHKKSLKILKQHLEWKASPERGFVGPKALKLLEEAIIYISGRDKQFRPIIVVNAYRADLKKNDMKDFTQAITFVLDTARKYYFVPGKVENWVIIIESNGAGILDFPTKLVKAINDVTATNYTSTLDKLYIMNPSSFLKKSWNLVQSLIDPETATKIAMLQKEDFPQLLERISIDQLEQCYGGRLPARSVFWPPVNTLNQPPYTKEANTSAQSPQMDKNILPDGQAEKEVISQEIFSENNDQREVFHKQSQKVGSRLMNDDDANLSVKALPSSADANKVNDINNGETNPSHEPSVQRDAKEDEDKNSDDVEEWDFKGRADQQEKKIDVRSAVSEHAESDDDVVEGEEHQNVKSQAHHSSAKVTSSAKKESKVSARVTVNDHEEEPKGVVLERYETSSSLCGFCAPRGASDDNTSSSCSIF